MRLICPYIELTLATEESLEGLDVEYVDVSSDDEAYWRLLSGLWTEAADFALIEHDIIAPAAFLNSFDACDHEWCAYSYRYKTWEQYTGLGCVRFRASLMRAEPHLMDGVGNMVIGDHPRKHWCTLDSGVQRWLGRYQRRAHVHGMCEHISDGSPTHDCGQ